MSNERLTLAHLALRQLRIGEIGFLTRITFTLAVILATFILANAGEASAELVLEKATSTEQESPIVADVNNDGENEVLAGKAFSSPYFEEDSSQSENKIIMYRDRIPIEVDYDKGVLIVQGKEIPIIVDGDVDLDRDMPIEWECWNHTRFDVCVEQNYYNNNTPEIDDFFDKFEPRYELMENITGWSSEKFYGTKLMINVTGISGCYGGYAVPGNAVMWFSDPLYKEGPYCLASGGTGELEDKWPYMGSAMHEVLHSINPLPIFARSWLTEGFSEYYEYNLLSDYGDISQETADYYVYNGIKTVGYNWTCYVDNDYHDCTYLNNTIQESAGYSITAWMLSMLRDNYSLPWETFYSILDNNPETMDKSMDLGDYYTDTYVIDLFERATGVEMYPVFRYDGPEGPGWGVRNWTDLEWYADLTPILEVSDTTPVVDDTICLDATVYNNGDVTLNDVVVRFYSDSNLIDEQVVSVVENSFTIVTTEYSAPEGLYCMRVAVDEDDLKIEKNDSNNEDSVLVNFLPYLCGDVNIDRGIDLSDVIYLANYLLKGGDSPQCNPYTACADVDGDGPIDLADCIYLANYILKSGPAPVCS